MNHRAMVQTMALLHGIKAGCLLPHLPPLTNADGHRGHHAPQ